MAIQFNVYVSKAFDYLSANTHYTVTLDGTKCLYFQNHRTGGGTVLYKWEVEKVLNSGWMMRE